MNTFHLLSVPVLPNWHVLVGMNHWHSIALIDCDIQYLLPTFVLEAPRFIDLTIGPVLLQNLKTISVQSNTMLGY